MSCDSCQGLIGGPRLFCLDCVVKTTEMYDFVDLCCAPQCVGSRITHREDLESAHEPNHRLVKVRTPVLMRNHARAHTGAIEAFQRVRGYCVKIAEFSSHTHEGSGPREQQTSTPEPTLTETPAKGDMLVDLSTASDETKDTAEDKTTPGALQGQGPDQDLPACGKCKGSLSFPFWYCIFCEGQSRVQPPLYNADHPFGATR